MKACICQVLPALEGGGVERGTVEVAHHLVRHGYRALVVSAGGPMVRELEAAGAEHFRLPIGRKNLTALTQAGALRGVFAQQRVDIVHVRSRLPAWLTYFALRGMAAPPVRISTVHGAYGVNRYSAIMLKANRVIAISDFIRQYILDNYPGVDPARICVIPRGIDPTRCFPAFQPADEWRQRWRREFPALTGKRLLTLPARLTRRKGHLDFLAIIRHVVDNAPDVHGVIVGGAHASRHGYRDELLRAIADRGLQHHVTLTGHREDLREIMADSAICFGLSEEPEAFGRTTLEALSLGRPVIAYDHGGTAEIMRELFPAGRVTPGDITRASQLALGLLGSAPAITWPHPLTLDNMLARTLDVYERALA